MTPNSERDEFTQRRIERMWVCACVKRNRKGQMTHIKAHDRSVTKCRRCGCTRKQHDEIAEMSNRG